MRQQVNPEAIIQMISELIETCQSGRQGFAEAAERLSSISLKNIYLEQSRVRAQFGADLLDEMRRFSLGAEPDGYQGTKNLDVLVGSDSVTREEEHDIVAACRKADDLAIHKYEQALAHLLPTTLRSVIEYQYRSLKQARDQMQRWDGKDGTQ